MNKIKVLFICTGNICRSPLAHRLFERVVNKHGMQNKFEIDSCGTGAWHEGENADMRMRDIAKEHGWKLEKYSRKFKYSDLQFDYLIAMDMSHVHFLKSQIRNHMRDSEAEKKIHLIREYDIIAPSKDLEVSDPYYGGHDGFRRIYNMIDRSCEGLFDSIVNGE